MPTSHAKSIATDSARINRTNAQRSTGPKTAQGKSRSVLNALKTGLTGRTVLLPADDADAYRNHVKSYAAEFKPVGPRESALVQSLADHAWRLDRIVALEMSIYAVGHHRFSTESDTHATYLQYQAHLAYEKQLRNLHIQEARLRRYRAKDMAELKELQQTRRAAESASLESAAELHVAAKSESKPLHPSTPGFEFSTAQIEQFIATCLATKSAPQTDTVVRLSPGVSAKIR